MNEIVDPSNEAAPVVETQPALPHLPNLAVRVVQLFTAPGQLFGSLRLSPKWVGAVLLGIAGGLVVQALIPLDLIREVVLSRLPADASADQRQAMEGVMQATQTMRWVGTVLVPPIFFAIIAAFLMLVFNVLMGGQASFKQLYATTAHANLIGVVGGLVSLPLILARKSLDNPLALNVLAPGLEPDSFAFRVLNGMGLFGLWTVVVLGIGVSRMYPKVKTGTAVVTLLAVFVVLKLIFAVAGGMGG